MTSQPPGTKETGAGSSHGPLPPLLLLLTVVTGGAVLAARKPGTWRKGKA